MSQQPSLPGGPERAIFVVALRRMSSQCEVPDLTPECPFYETNKQGPVCAEQCIDVLAEHGRAGSVPAGQRLGPDLAAIQRPAPRSRRSPEPDARPFDAARIQLRDRDRPTDQKATTTLISDIRDLLVTPPACSTDQEDRANRVRAAYDELARRGVDTELLVRCGLAPRVASSVALTLLAREILADSEMSDTPVEGLPEPDERWLALLERSHESDEVRDIHALFGTFAGRVLDWMAIASLQDIIDWAPPTEEAFLQLPQASWPFEQRALATWQLDRFTATYMQQWHEDSLAMEWSYLHGSQTGCCRPEAMRERPTDATEVARLLANLHERRWRKRSGEFQERRFSTTDFTTAAAENLAIGRQEIAAGIFAAVLSLSPEDSDANNNYGFCILPTDTERALHHLEKAAATIPDHARALTNSINRVLALHLLDRDDEALALAEAALEMPPSQAPAFLWQHGPEPLKLAEMANPRSHLEQLYEHLLSGERYATCRSSAPGQEEARQIAVQE